MADTKATAPSAPAPAAPAAAPKLVNVTVDGKPVQVAAGTNLIEAARKINVEVPYYCYHPKLSIAANCRMCLVEASTAPKLVPACQTPVAEGMAVKTAATSQKVKDEHRAVLEFLLLNHPVDCPICDQAGECKLQDLYMKHDHLPSRLQGGKVLKEKRKVIGPLVVLDQERCILCTRCVRFMREIARQPQLGVFGRGSHEAIDTFPEQPLDSKYAGNTVDICPVGALTNRDFRFKARAFYLTATPSVCSGCARGCNAFLDHFDHAVHRYRPRENNDVNQVWLCDEGRLSYKYLNADRALKPLVGRAGEGRAVPREQAVQYAADKLRPLAGQPALAFLASPLASVEDLLASFLFAKEALKLSKVYVGGRPDGDQDAFLIRGDKNPNRKGLEHVAQAMGFEVLPFDKLVSAIEDGQVKALYAAGMETPQDPKVAASVFNALELFVAQAFNQGPVVGQAHVVLPAAPHSEGDGSFVNFEGKLQGFLHAYRPQGDSMPHWYWAGQLLRAFGFAKTYRTAREVYEDLGAQVPVLREKSWDALIPAYPKQVGVRALAAAADGRPPNYRDREDL